MSLRMAHLSTRTSPFWQSDQCSSGCSGLQEIVTGVVVLEVVVE